LAPRNEFLRCPAVEGEAGANQRHLDRVACAISEPAASGFIGQAGRRTFLLWSGLRRSPEAIGHERKDAWAAATYDLVRIRM
jgi:hypothetical protein